MSVWTIILVIVVVLGIPVSLILRLRRFQKNILPPSEPPQAINEETEEFYSATRLAGHTLVGWQTSAIKEIDSVRMHHIIDGDVICTTYDWSLHDLYGLVTYHMAGIAAGSLCYGKIHSLASATDLAEAYRLAERIVASDPDGENSPLPEVPDIADIAIADLYTPYAQDPRVIHVLNKCYGVAQIQIAANNATLIQLRERLLKNDELLGADLIEICGPRFESTEAKDPE